MQCSKCAAEIPDGASFCGQCGAPIAGDETPSPEEATAYPDDRSGEIGELEEKSESDARPSVPPQTPRERFEQSASQQMEQTPDEPEQQVWRGSYATQAMYGHFLTGLIVAIVLSVLFFKWRPFGQALAWSIIGLLVIQAALYGWLLVRKLSVKYELTTQRLIHQKGLFSRTTDRIELIDIDDVTYRQGPVQRMLNVGTIRITSSDRTHPELDMPGIEGVREISDKIDDLRRAERRRRSLHIEAI